MHVQLQTTLSKGGLRVEYVHIDIYYRVYKSDLCIFTYTHRQWKIIENDEKEEGIVVI